ncbi:MAG: DUF2203 domain-containing protein [Phycisphaerae bacterium]
MSLNPRTRRALEVLEEQGPPIRFTVAQAEASLVLLRRVVADIVAHFNRLLQLQEDMEQAQQGHQREAFIEKRDAIRTTFGSLQSCRREVEQIGAILKDWGKGIVHFPCYAHGREVYLCWRYNEPHVEHWHEMGGCLYDRRPIGTLVGLGNYQSDSSEDGIDQTDPMGARSR